MFEFILFLRWVPLMNGIGSGPIYLFSIFDPDLLGLRKHRHRIFLLDPDAKYYFMRKRKGERGE